MRKTIAILVLLSFFIQVTGYHLYFGVRRWEARFTMRNNLRRHLDNAWIQEFVFVGNTTAAGSQPEWEEDNEFRLHGDMYDVISKEQCGDTLRVSCIRDDRETELIDEYLAFAKNNYSGKEKQKAAALKLLNHLFTCQATIAGQFLTALQPHSQPIYNNLLLYSPHEVLTPPPRC